MREADRAMTAGGGPVIRRLLGLAWQYKRGCLRAVLLQVLLLSMAIGGLNFTGLGIDFIRWRVVEGAGPPRWPFGLASPADLSDMAVLALIAGCVLLLSLLRSCLTYLYTVGLVRLVQQGIVVDLRARVYDKLQRLSFRFFDGNASGTLINRITSDVQMVRLFVDGVLIQGAVLLIALVVYLACMARIDPRLTLACLGTFPVMWWISAIFSRRVKPAYVEGRNLVDRMILALSESVQGIHVVKGFAREKEQLALLGEANRAVRDQKQRVFWGISLYAPSIEFLAQINVLVLLGYGGWLVIEGGLALGTGLIVFLGLLQRFSAQVNQIAGITDSIQQSLAAAARVFEVLDAPLELASPSDAVRAGRVRGAVRFERVTFGYQPGEIVLDGVDFDVPAGGLVGILGTTGAGKSTLLSLIPRFYDVAAGRVLIDGVDVRRMHLEDVRRNVGLVFQESFLFSNTVAANIAFGHPDATREQVERAATIAAAHEFIAQMPEGYDTVLGEGGIDLSGGQRQRLAIARAILPDPPILLLDDPTASVDAQTEQEILDAVDRAMEGRTTFLVTHRISVLRRADLILVLHRGRLEQNGTHEELMRIKGHYRRTAHVQLEPVEGRPAGPGGALAGEPGG